MSDFLNPAPAPAPDTLEFWEAGKAGRFLLKYCRDCDRPHWYPRAICPFCFSAEAEWREASGRGKIYSFAYMRRAAAPYVIAYVTLDEGPTMMTNIINADPSTLATGQAVEIAFRPSDGEWQVPLFSCVPA